MECVTHVTGDTKRALDFYVIAAHLTPRDTDLWRRVALLSGKLRQYPLAIDCLSRVIRLDPDDIGAKWDRAVWYHQVREMILEKRKSWQLQLMHGRPRLVSTRKQLMALRRC